MFLAFQTAKEPQSECGVLPASGQLHNPVDLETERQDRETGFTVGV